MPKHLTLDDASILALLAENPGLSSKHVEQVMSAIESPSAKRLADLLVEKNSRVWKHSSKSTRDKAVALKAWGEKSRSARVTVGRSAQIQAAKSRKKR